MLASPASPVVSPSYRSRAASNNQSKRRFLHIAVRPSPSPRHRVHPFRITTMSDKTSFDPTYMPAHRTPVPPPLPQAGSVPSDCLSHICPCCTIAVRVRTKHSQTGRSILQLLESLGYATPPHTPCALHNSGCGWSNHLPSHRTGPPGGESRNGDSALPMRPSAWSRPRTLKVRAGTSLRAQKTLTKKAGPFCTICTILQSLESLGVPCSPHCLRSRVEQLARNPPACSTYMQGAAPYMHAVLSCMQLLSCMQYSHAGG